MTKKQEFYSQFQKQQDLRFNRNLPAQTSPI